MGSHSNDAGTLAAQPTFPIIRQSGLPCRVTDSDWLVVLEKLSIVRVRVRVSVGARVRINVRVRVRVGVRIRVRGNS